MTIAYRLGEIAERFNLELRGNAQHEVTGVCSLANGSPNRLAYLADATHSAALAHTRAGAVIVHADAAPGCPGAALVSRNPKLDYALVAALFVVPATGGVHTSASISAAAVVHSSAHVGANAVIGAGAHIGAGAVLAAGCVIGDNAVVGEQCEIGANACIGTGVEIGQRVRIGPAAVLGDRGFGLVHDGTSWQPIPQLGSVKIGDDCEIGAGSTVDRGAIEDTVIEQGVKIDDQVHIAHNCRIGAHTVIAGCTGIAGSCDIGAHCLIGGGVGIGDHVSIADNVIITGATQVPKDITEPGVYSSTFRAMPARQWRKRLAIFRKLDQLDQAVKVLRKHNRYNNDQTR